MYNGRLAIESVTALAAIFELRIDNKATTNGYARVLVRSEEVGIQGTHAIIYGYFTGLSAGEHTVSIWARSSSGGTSGTNARVNPNCFSTVDILVIKEFK